MWTGNIYGIDERYVDGITDVTRTFGIYTNLQNKKEITKDMIRNNVMKTWVLHNLYCKIIAILQDTFMVKPNNTNKLYSPGGYSQGVQ